MRTSFFSVIMCLVCGLMMSCENSNKPNGNVTDGLEPICIVADVTVAESDFQKYGEQVWNGLALSKDTLEALNVKLIKKNNKGDLPTTVIIFQEYAGRADVPIIFTNNSPLSKNVRNDAEKNKVNQIALVAGDIDFCDGFQWVLRDAIMQNQEGEVFAPVILSRGDVKRIAMLGVDDDYGKDGMGYVKKEVLSLKNDVVFDESIFKKGADFNSYIDQQLDFKPDAIYFAGREHDIIRYVNQLSTKLAKRKLDIPIYICDAFDDPDVLKGIGDNAKGIVFASYMNDFDNPEGQAFLKQYQTAYGKAPGIYAVDAYVCGQYITKLISEGNRTAEAINKAFETMTFDSPIKGHLEVVNHSVVSNVAAYIINDKGKKELLYKPSQTKSEE